MGNAAATQQVGRSAGIPTPTLDAVGRGPEGPGGHYLTQNDNSYADSVQVWKHNTAAAMSAADFPALATALDQIAGFAPPPYTNWASISRDGAAAARAQNVDAVKGSCRGCHDQYRTKYRTEMRTRPVP